MLSLMMALVSVCASAQVYIGGTAGISSNTIGDGRADALNCAALQKF